MRSAQRSVVPVAEPLDRSVRSLCRQRPVSAFGHLCELVSSRSCVQLGSYLRAWTLLDILGVLLCFWGLAYGVDRGIIMSPSSKSSLAPY